MYRFITALSILALLSLAACERQEQRPAERAPGTTGTPTEQRETTPPATTPSQTPGQTETAPGQTPGQTPGQAPGQAPAGGEQR